MPFRNEGDALLIARAPSVNWTEWACEHGQITKIWLSDGCKGETMPMTVKIGYDHFEFEGYPGNVG